MADDHSDRRGLTFSQAEGLAALPTQMALRTVSPELSARLWAVIYPSMQDDVRKNTRTFSPYWSGSWGSWLKSWWTFELFKPVDDFPSVSKCIEIVKHVIFSSNYARIFDFVQSMANKSGSDGKLTQSMRIALEKSRSPYRLIGDMVVPIVSDEQATALSAALALANSAEAKGPYSHLRRAASALSAGDWAGTVQESIHAVEGAAKSIEPDADTLGPALNKLQASINLPPALKKAFGALYGWTSDEAGLRHALVFENKSVVNERDALFMFGACASFVGYLLA